MILDYKALQFTVNQLNYKLQIWTLVLSQNLDIEKLGNPVKDRNIQSSSNTKRQKKEMVTPACLYLNTTKAQILSGYLISLF